MLLYLAFLLPCMSRYSSAKRRSRGHRGLQQQVQGIADVSILVETYLIWTYKALQNIHIILVSSSQIHFNCLPFFAQILAVLSLPRVCSRFRTDCYSLISDAQKKQPVWKTRRVFDGHSRCYSWIILVPNSCSYILSHP